MKLFASHSTKVAVKVGSIFECVHDSGLIESAEVLDVSELIDGISHVRFRAVFERSGGIQSLGEKILSMESFTGRYRERG